MTKKKKKRPIYSVDQKRFNTFRELKWHMYLNMQKNTKDNAYQMWNDEILKESFTKNLPSVSGCLKFTVIF